MTCQGGTVETHQSRRHLRCFISATMDADLGALREALAERCVELVAPFRAGASLSRAVSDAICSSDFVIAVVGRGSGAGNVLIEAGIALGLERPVLVLSPTGADVPSDLASALTIRAEASDAEAIRFNLDRFLEKLKLPKKPRRLRTTAPKRRSPELGDVLEGFSPDLTEKELERLLSRVLSRMPGVTVQESGGQLGGGPDFAVWVDDLGPDLNPVALELKGAPRDSEQVAEWRRQLLAYTTDKAARLSVLLVCNLAADAASAIGLGGTSSVLLLDLMEFVRGLQSQTLADILREARNRIVHGRP